MTQGLSAAETSALALSFHGINYRLESDHLPFVKYARQYLAGLFEPCLEFEAPAPQPVDALTRLHWNAAPPAGLKSGCARQWGRRLWQVDGRALLAELPLLPGCQIEARWLEGRLEIDAYYRPVSWRERVGLRLEQSRERLFSALVYYLVYFPLIHYLEQTRGWQLLHSAAIQSPVSDRPESAVLLAGLPGSGKTTLSLALLGAPQAQLVSDNLLLAGEQRVYACPENIHVSAQSLSLLPPGVQDRLADAGRGLSYNRRDHALPATARCQQSSPRAFFFVGLSDRLECRLLQAGLALERSLAFDEQAREIQAYRQFAASLELIAPQQGSVEARLATLRALFNQVACYELWLERDAPLQAAVELVNQTAFSS